MLYAFLVGCSIATCEFAVSCVSMNFCKGRLAQWWRRCLTSTRSLVRTQYRPPDVSAGQMLKSFWPASFLSPKTEKCAASVPKVCKLFWKSPKSTFCGRYVDERAGGGTLGRHALVHTLWHTPAHSRAYALAHVSATLLEAPPMHVTTLRGLESSLNARHCVSSFRCKETFPLNQAQFAETLLNQV